MNAQQRHMCDVFAAWLVDVHPEPLSMQVERDLAFALGVAVRSVLGAGPGDDADVVKEGRRPGPWLKRLRAMAVGEHIALAGRTKALRDRCRYAERADGRRYRVRSHPRGVEVERIA